MLLLVVRQVVLLADQAEAGQAVILMVAVRVMLVLQAQSTQVAEAVLGVVTPVKVKQAVRAVQGYI
jgi:hypothetical protein